MIITIISIYLVGLALLSIPWGHNDIETHELVWWPIFIIKLLIKTLWRILTTGWK